MTTMTYLVLCLVFLAAAALIAGAAAVVVARRKRAGGRSPSDGLVKAAMLAFLLLFILTAVFDNVMIAVGLFSYAEEVISGLRIGLAPVEDFAYPLAAVILLPALWLLLEPLSSRRRHRDR